jgi:prephenate dehydrogenase
MNTVAIVGVGLIGGSFALALRKAGFRGRILGVSREETLQRARAAGIVDAGVKLEEALGEADLIYLSHSISNILRVIPLLDGARPGALITDAGSTKAAITAAANRPGRAAQFLGGHPMAGKEVRGAEAADPDLFQGRTYFLTPREVTELETPPAKWFTGWLEGMGARIVPIAPAAHDHLVAYSSHLAQMAATALAATVSEEFGAAARTGAGPGLHDMTRLAQSSYELWADIVATNRDAIDGALAAYIGRLEDLRRRLGEASLADVFEIASQFSLSLRKSRG